MSIENIQTIQTLYEAFRQRDLAKVFSLLSPDVEIVQSEELPWGGNYQGYAGARQFFAKLGSYLNSALTLERFISSGDEVIALGWTEGIVNATGARYKVAIAHVWTVRDGSVTQAHFFIDHPTMFEALAA